MIHFLSSLRWVLLLGVVSLAACTTHVTKDTTVSSPQLHEFSADTAQSSKADSAVAYTCQVSNLSSHKSYEGHGGKKNTAIKEARQSCLADASPQHCSVSFVCQHGTA